MLQKKGEIMQDNYEVTLTIPCRRPFKNVFQFRITLLGTNPPVWRRIVVPESYTFYDLHVAIQDAMGWMDYHLHCFEIRDKGLEGEIIVRIVSPAEDPEFEEPMPMYSTEIPIKKYFQKEKDRMLYIYDFGDGWRHEVFLERIYPKQSGVKYPLCLDGQLACPPEDCGSISGYYNCIRALQEGDNSEGLLDWLGDWAPEDFDPAKVKFESPRKRFEAAYGD